MSKWQDNTTIIHLSSITLSIVNGDMYEETMEVFNEYGMILCKGWDITQVHRVVKLLVHVQ